MSYSAVQAFTPGAAAAAGPSWNVARSAVWVCADGAIPALVRDAELMHLIVVQLLRGGHAANNHLHLCRTHLYGIRRCPRDCFDRTDELGT